MRQPNHNEQGKTKIIVHGNDGEQIDTNELIPNQEIPIIKDEEEDELTRVRKLKGWQEVLVIAAIALWTLGVGYWMSGLNIATDFFGGNRDLEIVMIYLDACASAVGIANGLFIFFRMREKGGGSGS